MSLLGLLTVASTTTVKHPNVKSWFPRKNMWISLAQKLNRTDFCVSLAQPESPFHTCLIGVPLKETEYNSLVTPQTRQHCKNNITSCLEEYDLWDDKLPFSDKPDELEILGSLHAASCIYINSSRYECNEGNVS